MFDIDLSFDFTRRSSSPSRPEPPLASGLQSPPSTLSPPSSSSDSVSQDGRGGSPHWSAQAAGGSDTSWNTKSSDAVDFADIAWNWTQVMSSQTRPIIASSDEQYPMAIDPAALTYYSGLGAGLLGPHQYLAAGFQSHPMDLFALPTSNPSFDTNNQLQPHNPRQNKISLAHAPVTVEAPVSSAHAASPDDQELVTRTMEAAGIQVAVTSADALHVLSMSQMPPPNLSVPRLSKPDLAACPPLAKHAILSPAASSGDSPPDDVFTEQATVGISGRPKTSHTTIERRYRTNLNARILALRHAVPALRILDKDHSRRPEFSGDVVDERGFVDGVKAARKASKASILGKAAEYIHVLKKRESRLRHEAAGLRTLLSTLVGGDTLLREFDRNWRARYGGEEMDEVAATSDGDDGDEDVSDDEDVKPRKKAKTVKDTAILDKSPPANGTGETGKRKRGRPKKVQPIQEGTSGPVQITPPSSFVRATHDNENVQYLLGVFLFFSLFKPSSDPANSAANGVYRPMYDHHEHSGSVVSPRLHNSAQAPSLSSGLWSWTYLVHNAHTVLSILLLLSVIVRVLSLPRFLASWRQVVTSGSRKDRIKKILESELGDDLEAEEQGLRCGLGIGSVVSETVKAVSGMAWRSQSLELIEQQNIEKACWRLTNTALLLGPSLSIGNRISIVIGLFRLLPPSPRKLSSISLLCLAVSEGLAELIWSRARAISALQTSRGAVATIMRLSVHETWSLFSLAGHQRLLDMDIDQPPILQASLVVVVQTVGSLAEGAFLRETKKLHSKNCSSSSELGCDIDEATGRLMEISKGVKGAGRGLIQTWLDIQQGKFATDPQDEGEMSPLIADARDLLHGLGWLRCVMSSHTPSRVDAVHVTSRTGVSSDPLPPALRLRQALASSIFSSSDVLEDARDSVIDILYT
ncbi:hypothetical protein FRB96_009658 [Tulasnella sp. 330]|nr:hypothetical protein FRB96_009658 [Tulasnella sp. 330]KAG8888676.1 hypothetical protein FRB98_007042 [Tulasnella sp. 332]